jgi:hypothetical protein
MPIFFERLTAASSSKEQSGVRKSSQGQPAARGSQMISWSQILPDVISEYQKCNILERIWKCFFMEI